MPSSISFASLASRAIRLGATSGSGIRRFARNGTEEGGGGNLITKLWNGLNRFGGSLMAATMSALGTVFQFSWAAIWGLCVSASQFIWNFNWNASDADLDSQINSSFNALGGTLGATVGNALGWLACGAVPGAIIASFNEPMGLYILEKVGEEAIDEIAGNLATLIKQTATSTMRAASVWSYKNIRTLWRKPDSQLKRELLASGADVNKVNQAMAERNKPWSFAKTTEDFVDKIPNTFLKNFTEELIEEFADSCIEAGYVVAGSADSYLAMQRLANENILGEERTIEITLNRSADGGSAAS